MLCEKAAISEKYLDNDFSGLSEFNLSSKKVHEDDIYSQVGRLFQSFLHPIHDFLDYREKMLDMLDLSIFCEWSLIILGLKYDKWMWKLETSIKWHI